MADLIISSKTGGIAAHQGNSKADVINNNNNNNSHNFINAADHHHQKIPIWIGSDCKLLSGINRLTTCSQIIQSLIHSSEDSSKYVIVEKWRKMERKLDPHVRILKVWNEWGDQQNDVALIVRHYHSSAASSSSITTTCSNTVANDGYIDKRSSSSNKISNRRKSHHHNHNHSHKQQIANSSGRNPTNTEETAGEAHVDDVQMTESMEKILNLVLTQGETIQAQLRKLKSQEEQIERYEEHLHRIRSLKDGENYVVDSYLNEERNNGGGGGTTGHKTIPSSKRLLFGLSRTGSSSSKRNSIITRKRDKSPKMSSSSNKTKFKKNTQKGSTTINNNGNISNQFNLKSLGEVSDEDVVNPLLIEENELMERICQVNGDLTREEERLVKLGLKIKKYKEQGNSQTKLNYEEQEDDEDDDDDDIHNEEGYEFDIDQRNFISQLHLELESLKQITIEQSTEIEQNEQHLTEIETLLDEKHDCIIHLTYEIQLLDVESDLLQQRLLQITKPMPIQQSSLLHSQVLLPPPYEQAIAASSLLAANNYNNNSIQNVQEIKPSIHLFSNSCFENTNNNNLSNTFNTSNSNTCPNTPNNSIALVKVVTPNSRAMKLISKICSTTTNPSQSSSMILTTTESIINSNNNYCQSPNTTLLPNDSNNNSSVTTTDLSLQLKSSGCNSNRDHQDNDSNSDTGISSLHSSGDENLLFTLDTLV